MKRILTVSVAIILMVFACNKTRTAAPLSKQPVQPNPRLLQIEDSARKQLLSRIALAEAQVRQIKFEQPTKRIQVMGPLEAIHPIE